MSAVLGRVQVRSRSTADKLGAIFVGAFMFVGFGALPSTGRSPALAVNALGLATIVLYNKQELGRMRLSLPTLAYTAWAIASITWSINPQETTFRLQVNAFNSILMMLVCSVLPLAELGRSMLLGAYATVGLTLASLVIAPGTTLVDKTGYRSVHGWFLHKNEMAPYMAMVVALALALDPKPRRRLAAIVISIALVVASLSATGLIAVATVIGFDWLARNLVSAERERRVQNVLVALAGTAAAAFIWTSYLPQIVAVYGKDTSFSGRTGIWKFALGQIRNRPWLGYGMDAAWTKPGIVANAALSRIRFVPYHAHNGLIEAAMGLGLVGAALFLLVLVTAWRSAFTAAMGGDLLARAGWGIATMVVVVSVSEAVFGWPWVSLLVVFRVLGLRWRAGERADA